MMRRISGYIAYLGLAVSMALLSWLSFLWYRPEPTEQLAFIPKQSDAVVVLKPRALGAKLITELLFHREEFEKILTPKQAGDSEIYRSAGLSGIDPVSSMGIFSFSVDERRCIGVSIHLLNPLRFTKFLQKELALKSFGDGQIYWNSEWCAVVSENNGVLVYNSGKPWNKGTANKVRQILMEEKSGLGLDLVALPSDIAASVKLGGLLPQNILPDDSRVEITSDFSTGGIKFNLAFESSGLAIHESESTGGIPLDKSGLVVNSFLPEILVQDQWLHNWFFLGDSAQLTNYSNWFTGRIHLHVFAFNFEKGDKKVRYVDHGVVKYGRKNMEHLVPDFDLWLELNDQKSMLTFLNDCVSKKIADKSGNGYVFQTWYQRNVVFAEIKHNRLHLASTNRRLITSDFNPEYVPTRILEMRIDLPELAENVTGFYSLAKTTFSKFNIMNDLTIKYAGSNENRNVFEGEVRFIDKNTHSLLILIQFMNEAPKLYSLIKAVI